MTMNITINYLNPGYQQPPFKLRIFPSDTVAHLKYQIFDTHGFPIHEQRMFPTIPGAAPPSDDTTLANCGFAERDVIKMWRMPTQRRVYAWGEDFRVGIRPILGAVFLLQVRRSDTFAQVKRRIQDEQGYMANIQDFRFGDDEDGKTLDECGVVEPMTLHFQLKRKRKLIWLNGRAGVVGEEVEMGMVKREGEVGEVKGEKGEKAGGDEGGSTGDSSEGEEGSAGEGGDPEARRVRRRRDSGDRVEIRGLRSGGHSPAQ